MQTALRKSAHYTETMWEQSVEGQYARRGSPEQTPSKNEKNVWSLQAITCKIILQAVDCKGYIQVLACLSNLQVNACVNVCSLARQYELSRQDARPTLPIA